MPLAPHNGFESQPISTIDPRMLICSKKSTKASEAGAMDISGRTTSPAPLARREVLSDHLENLFSPTAPNRPSSEATADPITEIGGMPEYCFVDYDVQRHSDIIRLYETTTTLDKSEVRTGLDVLLTSAVHYARNICNAIMLEWCRSGSSVDDLWHYRIKCNAGWEVYGPKDFFTCQNLPHGPGRTWPKMESLLGELTSTTTSIEDLQLRVRLDHGWSVDTQGCPHPFQVYATDSQNSSDDEDDDEYRQMRMCLAAFQDDADRTWYKTEPIPKARMRRDIRAWSRLARYGCIKLSSGSMLLHKDKKQLPKYSRGDRRTTSLRRPCHHQQLPMPSHLLDECFLPPGDDIAIDDNILMNMDYTNFSYLASQPAWCNAVDNDFQQPVYHLVDEQSKFSDSEANGNTQQDVSLENLTRLLEEHKVTWASRKSRRRPNLYTGHSSGGSDSNTSVNSTSGIRKARYQRDKNGYPCTFPGCTKTYDRQCDLRQHKRSHVPEEQWPYGCEICGKRFWFPKDLRRHDKVCREKE